MSRNSRDRQTYFPDALNRQWIFSSPLLTPRVLSHLNSAGGTYILIVPHWEKVFWRSGITARTVAPPLHFQNLHHILWTTKRTSLFHMLKISVWWLRRYGVVLVHLQLVTDLHKIVGEVVQKIFQYSAP